MSSLFTETRTYVGLTGTQAFDGYAGLRNTGVVQEDGTVLVAAVGAPLEAFFVLLVKH